MDVMVFMHGDAIALETAGWDDYIGGLVAKGVFAGGSSLAKGSSLRLQCEAAPPSGFTGFIRLKCRDLDHARQLIAGNPAHLAGATIEICPMVEDPG